ncbi:MAG TPA: anti-sigma factor [Solirubrobacteraceae bacterium]|jgi:anti-sigma-K factor RskA
MSDHDALRDAAGAWVLGALDEDEAWRFAAHLDVCAACRNEVERLRVAADVLPLAAPPAGPPRELKRRLMTIVEAEARERRRSEAPARAERLRDRLRVLSVRPALAAAAATLLLLAGVGVGLALRSGGQTEVVALAVDAGKGRGATAQLVRSGDEAEVRVSHMPPPPDGRVYQVWLQRDGRAPEPDAVFTVDREGRGSVGVIGDVEGADAVLVTDEPEGGSRVPTRQPVVRGRLS